MKRMRTEIWEKSDQRNIDSKITMTLLEKIPLLETMHDPRPEREPSLYQLMDRDKTVDIWLRDVLRGGSI